MAICCTQLQLMTSSLEIKFTHVYAIAKVW